MVEDLVIYPHKVICSSYLIEFRTYGSLDEFGRQSSPVFLLLGATWIPVNRTQERDKPARNCSKDTAGKRRLLSPVFSSLLGIGEIDRDTVM